MYERDKNQYKKRCAFWCPWVRVLPKRETSSRPGWGGCLFGAPAGTRTPDTLLKRQVLYLLSYWGEQRLLCAFAALPKSKPNEVGLIWKGRRSLRMRSFRRPGGSGTEQASSDVAGMAGLEPTISESKSGVLPLHYIPGSSSQKGRHCRPFCSVGWDMGLEPTTPGTTIRCSSN